MKSFYKIMNSIHKKISKPSELTTEKDNTASQSFILNSLYNKTKFNKYEAQKKEV